MLQKLWCTSEQNRTEYMKQQKQQKTATTYSRELTKRMYVVLQYIQTHAYTIYV